MNWFSKYKIILIIRLAVVGFIVSVLLTSWTDGLRKYTYPEHDQITKRFAYIQNAITENKHKDMPYMGHEGTLFSLSYTALALGNLIERNDTNNAHFNHLARLLVNKIQSAQLLASFGISNPYQIESILYSAHFSFVLTVAHKMRVLTDYEQSQHLLLNNRIKQAFQNSKFGFLTSYPAAIWVPDNIAGLASIRFCEDAYHLKNSQVVDSLLLRINKLDCDSATQLPYSTINAQNGKKLEGPRGSMLGWSIIFASYVDHDVSAKWYKAFKSQMSRNRGLFHLFKEWPSSKNNYDDMDSGPTLWGYSVPANAFALGCAVIHGDNKVANKQKRLMNWGRKKVETDEELKYKTRVLKLDASPMMEALSLYLETLNPVK